jgi:hypothetical protein
MAMASLVWRKSAGQIAPPGAGSQYPQHAVHHFSVFAARTTACLDGFGFIKERFNQKPLFIS